MRRSLPQPSAFSLLQLAGNEPRLEVLEFPASIQTSSVRFRLRPANGAEPGRALEGGEGGPGGGDGEADSLADLTVDFAGRVEKAGGVGEQDLLDALQVGAQFRPYASTLSWPCFQRSSTNSHHG
jgi:hypothetical protein